MMCIWSFDMIQQKYIGMLNGDYYRLRSWYIILLHEILYFMNCCYNMTKKHLWARITLRKWYEKRDNNTFTKMELYI